MDDATKKRLRSKPINPRNNEENTLTVWSDIILDEPSTNRTETLKKVHKILNEAKELLEGIDMQFAASRIDIVIHNEIPWD